MHPNLQKSAKEVLALLKKSIDRRLKGLSQVSLAFSGGIDSTILAVLLRERVPVELITIGVEGSFDISNAATVASELDMPLRDILFTIDEIEAAADDVRRLISPNDKLSTEIAIPFYLISKNMTTSYLFAGQGADELFGGYMRYLRSRDLLDDLDRDVERLPEIVTNREVRVCNANGVEFFAPYLDIDLVLYVLTLPLSFKIYRNRRKIILREVGRLLGLPQEIISQRKKAMQYGSGVSKALRHYWRSSAAG